MSRKVAWPWAELGLEGRAELREVKRAYAARLKQIDRNDPEEFQRLQQAFDQAKRGAIKPKGGAARPSMAALARSDWHEDATPPENPAQPEPEAAKPRKPVAEQNKDAASSDPKPEPARPVQPAQTAQPAPEPKPAPEAAPRAAPKAAPWGARTDDLDALFDQNPRHAVKIWWDRFNAALTWPWQTEALENLLALDMARSDLDIRRRSEARLFTHLTENLTDFEIGFPRDMAQLLQRHYEWSTDGVGVSKRLGWQRDFHLVMHSFSQSFRHEKPVTKEAFKWHIRFQKAGVFLIIWLVALATWSEPLQGDEFIVAGIMTGILLAIVNWVLIIVLPLIALLAALLRLYHPALRAFQWAFPGLSEDLKRSEKNQEVWRWVLAGLLVSIFLIGGAMAR